MIVVNLAIPSGDLHDRKIGRVMYAKLSYSRSNSPGNGRITNIENVNEVSNALKQSLLNAKYAAMKFTGKAFEYDTRLQFKETYQTIQGRSWEGLLALAFTSLLTEIPLKQSITASCAIDENGKLSPVSSLERKIRAAREEGIGIFLVSDNQKLEAGEQVNTDGIEIIPVANLMQGWCIASGQAPWMGISK